MSSPHGSCEVDELIFDFVKFESPCGTPVLTSFSLSHFLSRHIAALQSERKDCTHFTTGTGMCSLHRVSIRYEWGRAYRSGVLFGLKGLFNSGCPRMSSCNLICIHEHLWMSRDVQC